MCITEIRFTDWRKFNVSGVSEISCSRAYLKQILQYLVKRMLWTRYFQVVLIVFFGRLIKPCKKTLELLSFFCVYEYGVKPNALVFR
jgi:hypothetical protein